MLETALERLPAPLPDAQAAAAPPLPSAAAVAAAAKKRVRGARADATRH